MPLAVSSPTRSPTLPDVPTTLESGYPNSAYRFWIGVFAPAKTPPDIVNKLNAEIQKALQVPAVRERLAKLGVQPMAMNAGEFDKFVKEELDDQCGTCQSRGNFRALMLQPDVSRDFRPAR